MLNSSNSQCTLVIFPYHKGRSSLVKGTKGTLEEEAGSPLIWKYILFCVGNPPEQELSNLKRPGLLGTHGAANCEGDTFRLI